MSVISIRSAAGIALVAAAVAGGGYAVTTYADAAQAKPAHATARADVTVRHSSTHARDAAPAVSPAPSKAPATPKPTPAMSPAQQMQTPSQQGQTSGQQWQTPAPAPQPTSSWSPMG